MFGGSSYPLSYDAENRTKTVQVTQLVGVSGALTASFVYDGDGNRVKGTVSGTTTAYLGEYFEWTGSASTMRKFYFAGSIRMAMRTGSSTLRFLLGDHLGSTSITTDSNGVLGSTILYYPWGGRRWSSGSIPTNYQYTDQRIESNLGLYFYNARWYDSAAGRFIQPDTDVPESQGVQAWDRYAYTNNNPLNLIDPTGHGGTAPKITSPVLPPPVVPPSNATLFSISGTIGVGPWFWSGGIDVVVTNDEIGVFQIKAAGPLSGGSEISGATGASEEATWVTPQFGGSALFGPIWGDAVDESVSRYQVTTLVAGGSISSATGEVFTSTDSTYGVINSDYKGCAIGPSFGLAPAEAHLYYTNAVELKPVSDLLTKFGRALGLLDNK